MPQAITAAQMSELTNAIILLIVAIVTGATALIGTYLYQWKVALPRQFKQRDEQRELELIRFKTELENKAAAEKVDIERDRMLPILVENMMQANRATVQMAESFHTTMIQGVQQTAAYTAQIKAHDGQLTANTDRLEELAQTVDTAITNIQVLKSAVDSNTDNSKTAALYAQQTLEIVKRKINQVVEDSKHDTGELPPLKDIAKDMPKADDTRKEDVA